MTRIMTRAEVAMIIQKPLQKSTTLWKKDMSLILSNYSYKR